jgi:hypothetical protein
MWILIAFLVVLVVFWTYGIITSKEFRDANIEGLREAQRERERRNAARRSIKQKRYDNYYRTGNRRFLYDDDFEG